MVSTKYGQLMEEVWSLPHCVALSVAVVVVSAVISIMREFLSFRQKARHDWSGQISIGQAEFTSSPHEVFNAIV